jgi:hypothetical protein
MVTAISEDDIELRLDRPGWVGCADFVGVRLPAPKLSRCQFNARRSTRRISGCATDQAASA